MAHVADMRAAVAVAGEQYRKGKGFTEGKNPLAVFVAICTVGIGKKRCVVDFGKNMVVFGSLQQTLIVHRVSSIIGMTDKAYSGMLHGMNIGIGVETVCPG